MKVRIIREVPVSKSCGLEVGEVFDVIQPPVRKGKRPTDPGIWVRAKNGEPVRLWAHEFDWEGGP